MSQPRPTDPIGSIGWTERTGGVLTARECLTLARPLLRGELSILAGRLAMVLGMHSGRRSSIDPASLVPPDSPLARDAEVAAQDLLTPAVRQSVIPEHPRLGFKREFAGLLRAEAKQVPRGRAWYLHRFRHERPKHSARALPWLMAQQAQCFSGEAVSSTRGASKPRSSWR